MLFQSMTMQKLLEGKIAEIIALQMIFYLSRHKFLQTNLPVVKINNMDVMKPSPKT